MDKMFVAIPICVFAFASCSAWQSSEPEVEKPAVATPAAPVEQSQALLALPREPAMTTKPVTVIDQNEVRRLQIRLKEAGFDPGPTDGIAGARTKAAFVRLQNACLAWQSIRGKSGEPEVGDSERNAPVSGQVRLIQAQLRNAGFDSGPIDGIFGVRTKAAWIGAKELCPNLSDFAGISAYPAGAVGKQKVTPVPNTLNTAQVAHASNEAGGTKQDSSHLSRPREEIRVLQLRLRDAGFDPGPFDGVMGPKTKSALQQYEASQRGKKAKIAVTANSSDGHY